MQEHTVGKRRKRFAKKRVKGLLAMTAARLALDVQVPAPKGVPASAVPGTNWPCHINLRVKTSRGTGIHPLSRAATRSKEVQMGGPSHFLMQTNPCNEVHATAAERVAHLRDRGLQFARRNVGARKIEKIRCERLRIHFRSRSDHTLSGKPFLPCTTDVFGRWTFNPAKVSALGK